MPVEPARPGRPLPVRGSNQGLSMEPEERPAPRRALFCCAPLAAIVAAAALALLAACSDAGPAGPPPTDLAERLELQPLPAMPHPDDNPPDSAKVSLGRLLFFDPVLSGPKDVACATCHHPDFAMADGRELPVGPGGRGLGPAREQHDPSMLPEARNAPTLVNVGFNQFGAQFTASGFMFWDGRARSLERLTVLPLLEEDEMRGNAYPVQVAVDSALERLREIPEYVQRFREAYPGRAARADSGELDSAVDSLAYARAVAQFVRSLRGDDSPYDRFVAGDPDALTAAQKRGLELFHGKAGCAECHSGPMLSDFQFHVVGAEQQGPGFRFTPHQDLGRWNVTELEEDRWAFRTPSLRNVAVTAPYTHAGAYDSLRAAVELFLDGGGDHAAIPAGRLDPELEPVELGDRGISDLVAFLESLTDVPEVRVPDSVPSGLPPAGLHR